MWQTNLIKLYCAVCDNSSTIEAVTQRQSNNFRPQFSDEECITVYLWGISQRRFEQKAIYEYTRNHLLEWFPKLPSYQALSEPAESAGSGISSAGRAMAECDWDKSARNDGISHGFLPCHPGKRPPFRAGESCQ